jgi:L-fuconolactonase
MIDAHQHFWKYDATRHAWISDEMKAIRRDFQPTDLKPLLDKHGIAGCVAVQVDQTEEETLTLLALANQHAFIKGVVGWIDLRNRNLDSRLEYFSALKKLKGFRHIVQGERPGFLAQRSFVEGVQRLHAHEFTYDLLIYHHQLEEAVAFVRCVPETRIVIDHIAKPAIAAGTVGDWGKLMRTLATFPNIYCKVSGMVTEAKWPGWKYDDFVPWLDVVTEAFGTDRLMYGSDWPVCLVAASYDQQFSIIQKYFSSFSQSEKKKILGENAERFYNL